MKKKILTALSFLAVLSAAFTLGCTERKPTEKTNYKVLFIGNSFTYYSDMPSIFGKIATAAGKRIDVDSVTQGSWTLEKFADGDDEYGSKVDDALNSTDGYDAVILQEHSTRPLTYYDGFLSGVKSLQKKINETQTNCKIYLYSTWGYESAATERGWTIPQMEGELRKAYEKAAAATGTTVSYVGAAFSAVYADYPEINLYHGDDKHPSYAGSYLAACVHAATIIGCDVRECDFNGSLDGGVATILKEVAYSTVYAL